MKNLASGSFVNKMGKLPAAPKKWQTFCLTGKHSSRMRTTCLLTVSRSIPCIFGGAGGSGSAQPPRPIETPWSCDLWCMLGSQPTPPPLANRMTDACENITLPNTSFLGSKKTIVSAVRYFICDSLNFSRCLPPANEVWGKVIFSQASVCSQGGSASSGVCIWGGLHPGGLGRPSERHGIRPTSGW